MGRWNISFRILPLLILPPMTAYIITFLGIYFICLFKFIGGPVLGTAAGYSVIEIVSVTLLGLMTSVIAFTFIGAFLREQYFLIFKPNHKIFTSKNRKIVKIWQRFGPIGVAAITPLFLSPIVGTLIMNAFGVKKKKIFIYMFTSGLFWAFFFASTIEYLLDIPIISTLLQ